MIDKMIAKTMVVLLLVVVVLTAVFNKTEETNYYEVAGTVYEVTENSVIILDSNGNLWEVEETLEQGKEVTLVMFDNMTESVEDDEIKGIQSVD